MCSWKIGSYMTQYMGHLICDEGEPDLQPSVNIVVRLFREVPEFKNYVVYFDNFYRTMPLLAYLYSQGVLSVGKTESKIVSSPMRKSKWTSK